MQREEIIVVGAGPAGLMAAYELSQQGRKVMVLEARDRIGGRACTLANGFELGAEFIHGELPITMELLREAGLSYTATAGEWVQLRGGSTGEAFDADSWPLLMSRLKGLKEDMSLQDFLTEYFPEDKYASLKDQAISYAEGYDTADASRASAMALYEEWSSAEENQYRIDKGYAALMNYLAEAIKAAGGTILLSHPVNSMITTDDGVEVLAKGAQFAARCVLIALPLGVLQGVDSVIKWSAPGADVYKQALDSLGFGDVIKFLIRFKEKFWEDIYPDLGFLLSSAPVPTWWTQAPAESSVFTGWMAGRAARAHLSMPDEQLLGIAIRALAEIFSKSRQEIEALIVEAAVANWSGEPYTRGAYAYAAVGADKALETLSQPLAGRIFFAGEYLYKGPAMGTVEAAFQSGRSAAARMRTH